MLFFELGKPTLDALKIFSRTGIDPSNLMTMQEMARRERKIAEHATSKITETISHPLGSSFSSLGFSSYVFSNLVQFQCV